MLVEGSGFDLVAYASALPEGAGFVLPLFRHRGSNMYLVQQIGDDDCIADFRDVDPREPVPLADVQWSPVPGDQAIWGFRDDSGEAVFGDRETMRRHLAPLIGTIAQPFVNLQVAHFCEDAAELVGAWRSAFRQLAEGAPRSAAAWRDVVVIPTQMRLAVEEAIVKHGFDTNADLLDRRVEVAVENGRVTLRLDKILLAEFNASAAARSDLERAAQPVIEAFDMAAGRVELASLAEGKAAPPEAPEPVGRDIEIAAFGPMATAMARQLSPDVRIDDLRRPARSVFPGDRIGPLILSRLGVDRGPGGGFRPIDEPSGDAEVLFVLFELSLHRGEIVDRVIKFAEGYRAKGRSLIAVIPHFPEQADEDSYLFEYAYPALQHHFGGVWILSDRSPHLRTALPYGPARSAPAALAHFRHLLDIARSGDVFRLFHDAHEDGIRVGVVCSAIGGRAPETMTEHAMMRLRHYMFDFEPVATVYVETDILIKKADLSIGSAIRHYAPEAAVHITVQDHAGMYPGPKTLMLEARGVDVHRGGLRQFEQFCYTELDRHKWRSRTSRKQRTGAEEDPLRDVPIGCKLFDLEEMSSGLKARPRRSQMIDGIVFTNAMIQRRAFATQVLNGTVPIHHSRIEFIGHIYSRRYAYVLAYLHQEKKRDPLRLLLPAAIDFLNLDPSVSGAGVGRAKIVADEGVSFESGRDWARLALPLIFSRKPRGAALPARGHAILILDKNGWRVDHCHIENRQTAS